MPGVILVIFPARAARAGMPIKSAAARVTCVCWRRACQGAGRRRAHGRGRVQCTKKPAFSETPYYTITTYPSL